MHTIKKLTKNVLLVFLTLVLVFNAAAQKSNWQIEQYQLSNGLTIILNEDHSMPEVFGLVITKAGGKNDPKNSTGLAHYMEHMLFKGTQTMGTMNWEAEKPLIDDIYKLYDSLGKANTDEARKIIQEKINEKSLKAAEYAIPNEMDKLLKSIGSTNINAGTGPDQTMFYNKFPANQIEKWLDLYSERFINPVFRSFQAELEVVYEEKNMYADNFSGNLIEQFQKQFFKNHPYGQQPLIGTMEHLKNPSLTNMKKFLNDYYVANNMALVLVGDFDPAVVKPLIEQKFGRWNKGDVPKTQEWKEDDFKGREFFEAKLSPIKIGILGYRTVPPGHDDEVVLEVCNKILSNQNQTGLLDKLSLNNKLLMAMTVPLPYNDHGATIVLFIPKIMGQSLEDAEKLIINQFDSLKKGKFDDWKINAIKYSLKKEFETQLESNLERGVLIGMSYSQGRDIKSFANKYIEKLNSITKEDVIKIANKYYGDNYLAFYSKMGFPKKDKIEKPGFKPLSQKQVAESEYTQKFNKIYAPNLAVKYIDFKNAIETIDLVGGNKLYCTKNPKNNWFSLKIKYGVGTDENPKIKYAAELMNYAGTESLKLDKFKEEFEKIGCTYGISSDKNHVIIEVEGHDTKLPEAMKLIKGLCDKPRPEQAKLNIILEGTKTERKMERSEPDNVASALIEYAKYKEKSEYINRLSMNEIKALNVDSLAKLFQSILNYQAEIHYVGNISGEKLSETLKDYITLSEKPLKANAPIDRKLEQYNENIIYLVNKKNALQSKNYIFMNSSKYSNEIDPLVNAFNLYFSGDFSGLVLQEIREFRSLAYGAGASFRIPQQSGNNCYFSGFVGTQCDKTVEAISVFNDLIFKMPKKPERIETIKSYLLQSLLTERPDFRNLSEVIVAWKTRGYNQDPAIAKVEAFNKLTFDDIVKFYETYIIKNNIVFTIVADEKRITNAAELKNYGKIIKVKETDLFKN